MNVTYEYEPSDHAMAKIVSNLGQLCKDLDVADIETPRGMNYVSETHTLCR
eukprot:CAMPEP_0185593884 /NCGR_PEP_ID=MMETSP0434-20130131/72983_1 /TAXON_ID=626734 ORGANISM="Favella taraikaensis, Strain Fe Narragansett Bay" /NCGR_SAMPLE_ID=MMETSP0434 /ASSEMBLY_ACC=CAM_ASM_000379 /LENGTH=50 /DNA_ID=CAMNT_0028220821 /DNA_START=133 /DNA_END=285 /DNA_ORIENTATION=+